MSKSYNAVVIGAGVFGSWTAYYLQRAGLSVALIDAYGAANSRASSGDESRIIRMSYGVDEIYTRWSHRSLAVWQEFFAGVGSFFIGPECY
jgi:glycine/D-amino acid oxidase-like deaminating enzyme